VTVANALTFAIGSQVTVPFVNGRPPTVTVPVAVADGGAVAPAVEPVVVVVVVGGGPPPGVAPVIVATTPSPSAAAHTAATRIFPAYDPTRPRVGHLPDA
jgi:hypothetical protein